MNRQHLAELHSDEDLLFMDGYDDAIIGIEEMSNKVVYSVPKIIEILMKQGATRENAIEFYEYNQLGAYVGERTPIFVDTTDATEFLKGV